MSLFSESIPTQNANVLCQDFKKTKMEGRDGFTAFLDLSNETEDGGESGWGLLSAARKGRCSWDWERFAWPSPLLIEINLCQKYDKGFSFENSGNEVSVKKKSWVSETNPMSKSSHSSSDTLEIMTSTSRDVVLFQKSRKGDIFNDQNLVLIQLRSLVILLLIICRDMIPLFDPLQLMSSNGPRVINSLISAAGTKGNKRPRCPTCNKVFKSNQGLGSHKRVHNKKENVPEDDNLAGGGGGDDDGGGAGRQGSPPPPPPPLILPENALPIYIDDRLYSWILMPEDGAGFTWLGRALQERYPLGFDLLEMRTAVPAAWACNDGKFDFPEEPRNYPNALWPWPGYRASYIGYRELPQDPVDFWDHFRRSVTRVNFTREDDGVQVPVVLNQVDGTKKHCFVLKKFSWFLKSEYLKMLRLCFASMKGVEPGERYTLGFESLLISENSNTEREYDFWAEFEETICFIVLSEGEKVH